MLLVLLVPACGGGGGDGPGVVAKGARVLGWHVGPAVGETYDDAVTAWVEDEGPGVPEIESGSVFDRFNRGAEHEPEPGGLGLGLWIVKSIVDRHGGRISVRRTESGRTRFEVRLPLSTQAE